MTFTETSNFTRLVDKELTNEEYRALQNELIANPRAGAVIQGTGGIRKLRFACQGKGKSGGIRVIYFYQVSRDRILFLTLYAKGKIEDLRVDQKKRLKAYVEQNFAEEGE